MKVFEAEGFACVRTTGDHMVFTERGVERPVVIPKYARYRFSLSRTISKPLAFPAIAILNCSASRTLRRLRLGGVRFSALG